MAYASYTKEFGHYLIGEESFPIGSDVIWFVFRGKSLSIFSNEKPWGNVRVFHKRSIAV